MYICICLCFQTFWVFKLEDTSIHPLKYGVSITNPNFHVALMSQGLNFHSFSYFLMVDTSMCACTCLHVVDVDVHVVVNHDYGCMGYTCVCVLRCGYSCVCSVYVYT